MKKIISATLAVTLLIGTSACASIGGNTMTPQQELDAVAAGFALAEATYDSICSTATPPTFCADHAAYDGAKAAVQVALQTAQDAINASGGNDSQAIENLIADVGTVWQTYENLVNQDKAKARALGLHFRG